MNFHNSHFSSSYGFSFGFTPGYIRTRSGLIQNPFRLQIGLPHFSLSIDHLRYDYTGDLMESGFSEMEDLSWIHRPIDDIYGTVDSGSSPSRRITSSLSPNQITSFRKFEHVKNAGAFSLGVAALAMKEFRMNSNIHFKVGSLTNYWSRYSFLRNASNKLSYGGYTIALANLYFDTRAYQANTIGAAELGFNTMTNFYGAYIGAAIGGPPGIVLGFSFDAMIWGSKQFYNSFVQPSLEGIYMRMYNMTHPSIGNWNPYGR